MVEMHSAFILAASAVIVHMPLDNCVSDDDDGDDNDYQESDDEGDDHNDRHKDLFARTSIRIWKPWGFFNCNDTKMRISNISGN